MERIKDIQTALGGDYPDEQVLLVTVGELRKHADPFMTMAAEAASAFDNEVRDSPGLPRWKPWEEVRLERYAAELAALAERMKADAALLRDQGHTDLPLWLIRIQLLTEETGELAEAVASGDVAHALNELVDVGYVADGTHMTLGTARLRLAAHAEVHEANMTKLVPCETCIETDPVDQATGEACPTCSGRGRHALISSAGRWLKGPGYRKPDMEKIIKEGA